MYREDKQLRERHAAASAARRCAVLGQRCTSLRARIDLRIAEDDSPEHPARPPCTLTKKWSNAPPHNTRPAYAGEPPAGPHLARCFVPKGGDE